MVEQSYFIGEAAKKAKTTIKAIRYYERIGLIANAPRSGKYRLYTDQIVERIQFIKSSQTLGFSLHEIQEILSAYDLGNAPCKEVDQIVDQKLPLIEQKIKELQALHRELSGLKKRLSTRDRKNNNRICPMIYDTTLASSTNSS